MNYRDDIDGLRALAILPVLLFHSGVSMLSGGYVGVDVFFVISGFVITRKIVDDIEKQRFSIRQFYLRRIRRIMPALFATMFVSAVGAFFLFLPNSMMEFSKSLVATGLFVSNMFFWKNSGYFETAALDRPLLHTWSLSVEEQFYVFIPLFIYLTYRISRRASLSLTIICVLASFGLSVFIADKAPTANFFLLPTRAWELLIGVALALYEVPGPYQARPDQKWLFEILAATGLIAILFAVFAYSDATLFPGAAALLPTVGAALIISANSASDTWVRRLLSSKVLVGVGLISYSLYMVHWPVIVFTRYALLRDLNALEIIGVILLSIILAYLSWRYVERPFRGHAPDASPTKTFGVTATVMVAFVSFGIIGTVTSGFRARFPDFRPPQILKASSDTWLSGRCFLQNQDSSAWSGDLCIRTTGAAKKALLWGDSFAAHYIPGLIKHQSELSHNIIQYTFAGCPPVLAYRSYARPSCEKFNASVFDVIKKYQIDSVVLSARWDELRQRGLWGLSDTIDALNKAGVKVFVLGQSPMFGFDVDMLEYRDAGQSPDKSFSSWYLSFGSDINRQVASQSRSGTFVDPLPTFCEGVFCKYKEKDGLLFYDYGHFSDLGSGIAVASYFPLRKDR